MMAETTTTEMRETTAPAVVVAEPYEQFPCNELRRECYRRKLPVVKSGPQTNATKSGFMRLLRECDAARKSKGLSAEMAAREAPRAPTIDGKFMVPLPFVVPAPAPRVVSPPSSPIATSSCLPMRPPRVDLGSASRGASNKRDFAVVGCQDVGSVVRDNSMKEKKRQKSSDEDAEKQQPFGQPMSVDSFASTQTSSASTFSDEFGETGLSEPTRLTDKTDKPVVEPNLPRWERLHARLIVVTEKLSDLRKSRNQWPPAPADETEGDLAFYETMKRQLQLQLLDCVSHT